MAESLAAAADGCAERLPMLCRAAPRYRVFINLDDPPGRKMPPRTIPNAQSRMAFLWPSTLYALRHRVCATGTGPTAAVLVWPVTMMMLVPAAGQRFGLPDPYIPGLRSRLFLLLKTPTLGSLAFIHTPLFSTPPNPNPNPKRLPSSNPTDHFMRCPSSHSVWRLAFLSWQIRLISFFFLPEPKPSNVARFCIRNSSLGFFPVRLRL
ncbi:hypothetical protein CEP54_012481 [Fusarium duplospermum]|uniref:Uncharacterized protein n=1 Tax=Fusarium duplospermum TaxID=1325734 RepID=A0A428P8K7_9HYPO|nr:hypothetical protein CEP54_012481 [Fusarium duplospermum]